MPDNPGTSQLRKGCSAIDNKLAVTELVSRSKEWRMRLAPAFADFEKAFHSLNHDEMKKSLTENKEQTGHTQKPQQQQLQLYVLDNMQRSQSGWSTKWPRNSRRSIRRCNITETLQATLQDVFRKLNWNSIGVNVNGENLKKNWENIEDSPTWSWLGSIQRNYNSK